jgi:TonB-dependent receptor-like protein
LRKGPKHVPSVSEGSEVRSAGCWDAGLLGPALRTSHFALFLIAVAASTPLAAQVTQPQDTVVQADSARTDSLRRDATERLIAAESLSTRRVPVLPDLGGEGPRAAGSRLVLDRRDIAWRTAQTVSDLLSEIPGVYVWRGGWFGRSAYANYHGRGATSIDWVIDGVPFLPMGPDSVGVEPSLFALTLFERIEVERWPGGLRVLLYTPQYGGLAPRSRVGIATGQFDIARYQGDIEYRWKNGFGLTGAAEYFDSPTATGVATSASVTSGLYRAQFVPREDRGVQIQLLTQSPDRNRFVTGADTIGSPLSGTRSDLQARAYLRRGNESAHFQADVLYTRSRWSSDSVDQTVSGGGVVLALRRPRWRVGSTAWLRDRWTPFSARAEVGLVPLELISLNAEVMHEYHDGDRRSDWIGLRGSLHLPLGFEAEGGLRNGRRVLAPALEADTAQDIGELELRGRWRSRLLTLEAGWSRTDAFAPYRFAPYLQIDSLRAFGRTEWLEVGAVISPLNWLKLEGWYSDPQGGTPDGIPPTHSTVRGEIRSRFLRQFPSGIFELRLAGEMETWGAGTIGADGAGNPLPLRGATFFRLGAGLKLGGFQFYWDRVNTQSTKRTYVPGFKIPNLGQTFGIRWEFTN